MVARNLKFGVVLACVTTVIMFAFGPRVATEHGGSTWPRVPRVRPASTSPRSLLEELNLTAHEETVDFVHQSYSSQLHCVCGPEGFDPQSCAPLFRHAIAVAVPGESLVFYVMASSAEQYSDTAEIARQCIGRDVETSPKFYWPWHHRVKAAVQAAPRRLIDYCNARGWSNGLHWFIQHELSSPYHYFFDRGAFQAWMFQSELIKQFPVETVGEQAFFLRNTSMYLIDDHTNGGLSPALREFFAAALNNTRVMPSGEMPSISCARFSTFGYWFASPMTYRSDAFVHDKLEAAMSGFASDMTTTLLRRYGDAPKVSANFLVDGRPSSDYDAQGRARGIQPSLLRNVLNRTNATGGATMISFGASMTTREQFHAIRAHRVIIAGEGALFALMVLSAPQTTWIMIYNHTRQPHEWKHSSFHATVARGLSNVRLVVYVIDHGVADSLDSLCDEILRMPWHAGVVFLGADGHGNRRAQFW